MAKSRSAPPPKESGPKARPDAYVGLLTVSLLAQIAGAVFLYLDYSQYEGSKDPVAIARKLKEDAGKGTASAAPAPAGGPVAPVAPPVAPKGP